MVGTEHLSHGQQAETPASVLGTSSLCSTKSGAYKILAEALLPHIVSCVPRAEKKPSISFSGIRYSRGSEIVVSRSFTTCKVAPASFNTLLHSLFSSHPFRVLKNLNARNSMLSRSLLRILVERDFRLRPRASFSKQVRAADMKKHGCGSLPTGCQCTIKRLQS